MNNPLVGLTEKIAAEMPPLSHLECLTCHYRPDVGDVARKLRTGWPTCCGYTMRLYTMREVAESAIGD